VLLRLHTGYPKEWDKVQVGMTISQVRAICGPSTYSGEGMKPEGWEVPALWGRWILRVCHGEETQGPRSPVSTVELFFDHTHFGAIVMHHYIRPPVQDWDAFDKAFGQAVQPISRPTP